MGVKLVMLFPTPVDVATFERAYQNEQLPLVVTQLAGKTRGVLTRVLGAPGGQAPFYRITEIHFSSLEALQASLAAREAQSVAANAVSISSGGLPIFLVCDEVPLPLG